MQVFLIELGIERHLSIVAARDYRLDPLCTLLLSRGAELDHLLLFGVDNAEAEELDLGHGALLDRSAHTTTAADADAATACARNVAVGGIRRRASTANTYDSAASYNACRSLDAVRKDAMAVAALDKQESFFP